jgi:hypothetical protein
MKPRDIRRGISSRHVRSGGDAPDIGRVSRMHGQEVFVGGGQPRRRKTHGNAARHKAVMIWSVVLGVGTFLVMAFAVFLWLKPQLDRGAGPAAAPAGENDESARVVSKFPSPSREEAISLVKEALVNRDPAKVEQLFRTGTSTPEQIVDFCARSEERDGPQGEFDWLSSVDSDGLLIEGVVVYYKGKERPVQRLALLTPDANGRWRLDFDAFARIVKPAWSELLAGGGDHALVRVMVSPDVYYNGPFLDDSRWTCYAMSIPDSDQPLRGYCKAGSPEAEAMKKLFAEGAAASRVILEIRRVEGGEPRQFEISSLRAREWILSDVPGNG